ncbi:VOC family protein [Actinomadura sp. NEAU-AAG7]|uniref:VOC family protein n=1 Tax=Actinomadura sp. NEAU-AAG7 TaxID=2839640 RepID=UPI001BE3F468|nr:VOC family protein [Actinomadura sp. NEAU-AAG7]MBT2208213.1 VOC family protein [Actinomadura sp. NEAU-AAG7]
MTTPRPTPVPDGYTTVTPWIVTKDTAGLIDFITEAFGAEELSRLDVGDGVIGHAEARIGDAIVMMFDSPFAIETPGLLRLFVDDADAVVRRAVGAGATVVTEPTELFWGDKVGRVRDPLGNLWWIQQRLAEPTPDEIAARAQDPRYAEAMTYVQSSLGPALPAPRSAGAPA